MGPCRAQDGLSTDQMGPASSWKDPGSHQMTMVPLCFAICCAHRWGDTSISTTVVVIPAIIQRRSILTRECSQTPCIRKIGSHIVFTGAEWVLETPIPVKSKRILRSAMRCAQVRNTPWKWAVPTHSRLVALWHYFTRQSMLQMRRLVSDTFLMTATISVVRIP